MGDDSEWMKLPIDQKCEHKVSDPGNFYFLAHQKSPDSVGRPASNCQQFAQPNCIEMNACKAVK